LGNGGDLCRRGHHGYQSQKANRVQKDDHCLQTRPYRPHHHKISLPLRQKHRGLLGNSAPAESQRHRCVLRKREHQYADGIQRVPDHPVQRFRPGGIRIPEQECRLGQSKKRGSRKSDLPIQKDAGIPQGRRWTAGDRPGGSRGHQADLSPVSGWLYAGADQARIRRGQGPDRTGGRLLVACHHPQHPDE